MSQELWTAVDEYVNGKLVRPDAALASALEKSIEAGLPPISVSPSQGKLLYLLAKALRAKRVLEIGTLGGYSAIWFGRAVTPGGAVLTLEIDPKNARIAEANIARAGLADVVSIRVGNAMETIPQLIAENGDPFDLIFIDADKEHIPEYFGSALKLSRAGSVIIVDNVVREGAVIDGESTDPRVQGVRRFNDLLSAETRVSATTIQTVGSKGYDGFTVCLVL